MKYFVTVPAAEPALPEGFEDLEEFVSYWSVQGQDARRYQRSNSTMGEVQRFYDTVYPRAEDAIQYLQKFPLRDMPGPEQRLMRMVLSLAQASMAVEIHGQLRVPYSPWPNEMAILAPEDL